MKRLSLLLTVLLGLSLAVLPIVFSCATDDTEEEDAPPSTLDEGDDDATGAPIDDDAAGDDDDTVGDDDDTTPPEDGIDETGPCDGMIEAHQITYTPWADLSPGTLGLFTNLFASEEEAQIFYGRFIYWYGMARELARSARAYYNFDNSNYPLSRWEEERIAAQMAISYFYGRAETENLLAFHLGTVALQERLGQPFPATTDAQTFFENHEDAILANTNAILWYHAEWALEAIAAQAETPFHALIADHICAAVDGSVTLGPQQPHISFDDTLPQLVVDGFDADLANWELRVNPKLVLVTGQLPALITYF